MDYSSISHDPDHPTGTDPWASPRTSYPASTTSDVPSSPLPPHDADTQPADSSEQGVDSPDLSERLQGSHLGNSDYSVDQAQSPAQQSHPEQPRSQLPARYQTGPRQNARQPTPTYKIQGKITGLERTGKKDPILRFDIHVSRNRCAEIGRRVRAFVANVPRPISPNSGPRSTEMSVAPMANSSSSPNT